MACDLLGFVVNRLHVDYVIHEGNPRQRGEVISIQFGIEFARNTKEDRQFRMVLKAIFSEKTKDKKPLGYQVDSVVTGIIKAPDDIPADQVQFHAEINGAAILYGTLRGIIFNATGVFPGGQMVLKSIPPNDILKSANWAEAIATQKRTAKAHDVNTEAAAATRSVTGQPSPKGEDILSSPELQRQLREAKAVDKARNPGGRIKRKVPAK